MPNYEQDPVFAMKQLLEDALARSEQKHKDFVLAQLKELKESIIQGRVYEIQQAIRKEFYGFYDTNEEGWPLIRDSLKRSRDKDSLNKELLHSMAKAMADRAITIILTALAACAAVFYTSLKVANK